MTMFYIKTEALREALKSRFDQNPNLEDEVYEANLMDIAKMLESGVITKHQYRTLRIDNQSIYHSLCDEFRKWGM